MKNDYPYGYAKTETHRLDRQNALWRGDTITHWDAARIGPADRVLEIGCGPGFVTADLAPRVGELLITDRDRRSLDTAARRARESMRSNVVPLHPSVAPELPPFDGSISAAYLRWLLCYVGPEMSEALMRNLRERLVPGGRVLVHDYLNYRTARAMPDIRHFSRTVHAFADRTAERGGENDIGFFLPGIFARTGFRVTWSRVIVQDIRPGTPFWTWADDFVRLHVPSLAPECLTPAEVAEFLSDWNRAAGDPSTVVYGWPVLQIVAETA